MKLIYKFHALILIVALSTLSLVGCTTRATSQVPEKPVAKPETSRWVVFLIDVTLSYAITQQAIAAAIQALQTEAQPEDVWFFRTIDSRSYSDGAAIFTLRFPAQPTVKINPFDPRSKAKANAEQQALDRLKAEGVKRLKEFDPNQISKAVRSYTDIYGALAKAGELLAKAPQGKARVIICASDFLDNKKRSNASINLDGVRVVGAMFQSNADVSRVQQLRALWEERLNQYGASGIVFLDPSEGWPKGCLSATNSQ